MQIEITGETERLIQRAMASGHFASPQDCIEKIFTKEFAANAMSEIGEDTSIEELATQQNAKPFRMNDRHPSGIWPEGDSVDDFLSFVRSTRCEKA